mmetsp:Transcript_87788/g.200633  ORF Transcript_87788/g.200633 Transcript_87788/m.200633 type:complete len:227 (+) Transcript_87788:870-1550(+)
MATVRRASKVEGLFFAGVLELPARRRLRHLSRPPLSPSPKRKLKKSLWRKDRRLPHRHRVSQPRSHLHPRHPLSRRRQLSAHRRQSLLRRRHRPQSRRARRGIYTRPCRLLRSRRGLRPHACGRPSACWIGGPWRRDDAPHVRRLRAWALYFEVERCLAPTSPRPPRSSKRRSATICLPGCCSRFAECTRSCMIRATCPIGCAILHLGRTRNYPVTLHSAHCGHTF